MMSLFKGIPFSATANIPLYRQLCEHLQEAILSGQLRAGSKLPSTRALAEELNVSRNTVLSAYDQLMAEGYIETVMAGGSFVSHLVPDDLLIAPDRAVPGAEPARPGRTHGSNIAKRAAVQLTSARVGPLVSPFKDGRQRPFLCGAPAVDAFSCNLWARCVTQQVRTLSSSTLIYQNPTGYRPLREAIAEHVSFSRNVRCTSEQIVIVSGAQGAIHLAAQMLINEGDCVWMEDPGYKAARGALLGAGARLVPVPVDQHGLVVDAGIARAPVARLAYVTPAHQFPLGVTMSPGRRQALLEWAKETDAYILEDDYDSEYRFTARPLASLQGQDDAERVIYVGTFSKALFPALRIGYLILPQLLVEPFVAVRRLIDFHAPILEQAALAEFMHQGHYRRHLRRMRTLYAERWTALLEATRELPLEIEPPDAGIHCIGWLPSDMDEPSLVRRAMANGLNLWPVSYYSIEPMARQGVVLGYGGYSVPEIRDAARRLAKAMCTG